MGYSSEIFDNSKTRLVGKIVRATEIGNIDAIDMPDDKNIVTIASEDLSVKKIRILNDYIPVFAESRIDYAEQPVLAVFGQDIESVEQFIEKITLHITPDKIQTKELYSEHPVKFRHGDIEKYFRNPERIITSDSFVEAHCETLLSAQRILAKIEDDIVYIKTASQWPLHIRDSVAFAMQKPANKVYIVSDIVHSDYNQLVLNPSFASVIAATAARKTGMLCELQISMSSWQPETLYHFETDIDENNRILAHKVNVDIDLGFYPTFVDEICNHIMTGLVPLYKCNALSIQINIKKGNVPPVNFFVDLGYGIALAATENHFNFLFHKLHISPSEWRLENLRDINPISETVRKSSEPQAIGKTLEETVADSFFERSHAVYTQMGIKNKLGRSIMSYSRGIGISCGQGIQGFSNKFPYIKQYSVKVMLSENRKVEISVGIQTGRHLRRIYREIVQDYLDVDYQSISFININDESIRDAGPSVLSRSMVMIPKMLVSSCRKIKDRQEQGASYPISEESFYLNSEEAPYFESQCCGTVVVDLHIDTVRIIPVIDRVTARIKCGKVFDAQALKESIRHIISETIKEVLPYADNLSDIDLKIRGNMKLDPGSCSSFVRGLTIASLSTALSQALSCNMIKLPVSETDLMAILRKQGEQHAAELQN